MDGILDTKKLWDSALNEIEMNISKANFGTWFKHTEVNKVEEGIVFLNVPNTFVRDWLSNKYHKFILKALRDVSPDVRSIEYQIVKLDDKLKQHRDKKTEKEVSTTSELGLKDLYISKESNLNPKYTFNDFIVGSFNDVAYAATQAILKNPGQVYNPLFIYGGTGLGKTHLIQAVGNHLKSAFPEKNVFYVTSENFGIDYINSIQNNKANQFKEKYRKYDLLIMDDVQFFSNKEKFQEELFHLFNHLYENNKQIIFSSDKSPKYIPNLEERLRSRFEGGMIVDVSKPDYESRLAILQNKIKANSIPVAKEILEYLASVIQDNIRELEGALKSISCQINSKGRELTLSEVKQMIKHSIKRKKTLSIKDVLSVVAN